MGSEGSASNEASKRGDQGKQNRQSKPARNGVNGPGLGVVVTLIVAMAVAIVLLKIFGG